jgi:hypothetical protein
MRVWKPAVRCLLVIGLVAGALAIAPSTGSAATANPWSHTIVNGFSNPTGTGGWLTYADGTVTTFGSAAHYGDASGLALNGPIVGGAVAPDGLGYWLVARDGGIFSYGSAHFHGSMGGTRLNQPVFSMAPTPDGGGYWLVAFDGGIFSFGNATFYGSMGGTRLNQPITGITTGPGGNGYRMVARDGGIFSFGSAPFYGSAVDRAAGLTDVVGMAPSPTNLGYWIARANGTVYNFGDASDLPDYTAPSNNPVAAIFSNPTAQGYALVLTDGTLVRFGLAPGGFDAGVHAVPSEVPVGTYYNLDERSCAWARMKSTNPVDGLNGDREGPGPQFATLTASDGAFFSTCSGWIPATATAITSSTTASFGDGTFRVGTDVASGNWQAASPTARCYYERLNAFTGEDDDIIASATASSGPVNITIAPTDTGFYSEGCGTWVKQ